MQHSRNTDLDQLVMGRGRDRKKQREILGWIIRRTAWEFQYGEDNDWVTLDKLACEAADGTTNRKVSNAEMSQAGEDGRRLTASADKTVPEKPSAPEGTTTALIEHYLLHLPPYVGRVCESEKVSLTALGLLLGLGVGTTVTTSGPQIPRTLAKVASTCVQQKLDNNAVIGKDTFGLTHYSNEEQQWVPRLAAMLPGLSVSGDSADSWRISVYRTALEYVKVEEDPKKLLDALRHQATSRLGPGEGLWARILSSTWWLLSWVPTSVSVRHSRSRIPGRTVDPAPSWLADNVNPTCQDHRDLIKNDKTQNTDMQQDDEAYWASLLNVYATQFGSYTTMLWQVPALSLTAQAFLMTIALGDGSRTAKLAASVLSIVIAWASWVLMHDQRGHAINQGELALRVSNKLKLARKLGGLAVDDAKPEFTDAETVWAGWDHSIYQIWKFCLGLFIIVDVLIIILTFVLPGTWWPKS